MPRLGLMPKRKAGDKQLVSVHGAGKLELEQQLAEKYSKEIDEVCWETHMPQWSRDVISNEVIMDPILLPCGHRFDRENLCYKILTGKPFWTSAQCIAASSMLNFKRLGSPAN